MSMDDFLSEFYDDVDNPIDMFEAFLLTKECLFKRVAWDRLIITQSTRFCELRQEAHYVAHDDRIILQSFISDMILDPEYEALSAPLLMKINREQSYGHFYLNEAGHVVFKHSISAIDKEADALIDEIEEFRTLAVSVFERRYAALSVLKNHLKRLSEAGFVLDMDDFLPAINDNQSHINDQKQNNGMALAFMDIQGEG